MSQQPANADPSIEEQLVAYLDGELSAEASRRVEGLLASDPKVRQTLQGLDRTWELLDELETPQVAESFTRSTLEMVTVAAAEDTERSRTEASSRQRRRWVIAGGSLLAAAAAGFLVTALWPHRNQQLIDDLPVLENLDEYRQIDNIEFLRMLHEEGVFAEEAKRPKPREKDVEGLLRWMKEFAADPEHQDEISKAMPEEDKPFVAEIKQLLQDHEWFMGEAPAERRRLRQLHIQLKDDPELRRIMHAYCEWLKSLPDSDRAELLHLEPDERIKRIEELRAEEAKRPKPKDMEGLLRWMKQYAADSEHQAEIFKAISSEGGRERVTKIESRAIRSWVAGRIMRMQMYRPGKPDWQTDDQLADLRQNLSDETRKQLKLKPPAEQWKIISGWVRPWGGRHPSSRRFRGATPPQELQEKLDHFFEHELTENQKVELLNLPGDEMQRRLQRMYFGRIWGMRGPGFGPRRPGPPGPARSRSGRPGGGPREKTPRQNGQSRDR